MLASKDIFIFFFCVYRIVFLVLYFGRGVEVSRCTWISLGLCLYVFYRVIIFRYLLGISEYTDGN